MKKILSKTEYVYEEIKARIGNGEFNIGEVYTVIGIAGEIGVSRTPVSNAIKILDAQGYLKLYPGVGFTVKELTLEEIRENLLIMGALERVAIEKVLEKKDLDEASIKYLSELIKKSIRAIEHGDIEVYNQATEEFHSFFHKSANLVKLNMILQEHILLHESLYKRAVLDYPQLILILIEDHQKLLEAIIARDILNLARVIKEHENNCLEVLKKFLNEGGIQ